MMQSVASQKSVNRMSVSAVAACMAPLLLRPLLAGDCELGHGFDMGGDNSLQLMQAAAAANHAQAICITLLEEYNSLFGEGSAFPEPYSDTEESGSETEELTDDNETYEDDEDDYSTEGSDADIEDDNDQLSNETSSEIDDTLNFRKESECSNSPGSDSPEVEDNYESSKRTSPQPPKSSKSLEIANPSKDANKVDARDSDSRSFVPDSAEAFNIEKPSKTSHAPLQSVRRATAWGRAPARKNLSMESIDLSFDEEAEIERLEAAKTDLQNRVANEARSNAILQSNLAERKNALRDRRLALEGEVNRLQEQLQKERELRAALEAGLRTSNGQLAASSIIDDKMKAEIEEITQAELEVISLKQKADDLGVQLYHQLEQNSRLQQEMSNNLHQSPNDNEKWKDKQKNVDTTSTPYVRENSSRNKHDKRPDKTASDKAKKQGSSFSTDDNSLNKQTPSEDMGATKPASTNSRKSSSRSEGTNTTFSALSKLSNRLNFLKERRSQIANELQNMNKSQGSGIPSQNAESDKGSETRQASHKMDKSSGLEGQSSENNKGLDGNHQSDKARKPDLDRGKSESFPPADKGRSTATSRTKSR